MNFTPPRSRYWQVKRQVTGDQARPGVTTPSTEPPPEIQQKKTHILIQPSHIHELPYQFCPSDAFRDVFSDIEKEVPNATNCFSATSAKTTKSLFQAQRCNCTFRKLVVEGAVEISAL